MAPTAPRTGRAPAGPRNIRLNSSRPGQRHRVERRLPTSVLAVAAASAGLFLVLRHPIEGAATASAGTPAAMNAVAAGAVPVSAPKGPVMNGSVTGKQVDTDFGPMQVQITVKSGKITSTRAVEVTTAGQTSTRINARSLPVLYKQTMERQSAAKLDSVSGATVTSTGYKQALQSAIDLAHLSASAQAGAVAAQAAAAHAKIQAEGS